MEASAVGAQIWDLLDPELPEFEKRPPCRRGFPFNYKKGLSHKEIVVIRRAYFYSVRIQLNNKKVNT